MRSRAARLYLAWPIDDHGAFCKASSSVTPLGCVPCIAALDSGDIVPPGGSQRSSLVKGFDSRGQTSDQTEWVGGTTVWAVRRSYAMVSYEQRFQQQDCYSYNAITFLLPAIASQNWTLCPCATSLQSSYRCRLLSLYHCREDTSRYERRILQRNILIISLTNLKLFSEMDSANWPSSYQCHYLTI